MAQAIGVSSAYLSSLEHGRRGRPSWYLIQRIITYFNVIWDDAEELVKLANLSHPRIVARTAGLSPRATELCNRLAASVHDLREDDLAILLKALNEAIGRGTRIKIRE
jgi:transcriptional regulator with XRE-family HTH domain